MWLFSFWGCQGFVKGAKVLVGNHFTVHWNGHPDSSLTVHLDFCFKHALLYWSCNGKGDHELREPFPWISNIDATRSIHEILLIATSGKPRWVVYGHGSAGFPGVDVRSHWVWDQAWHELWRRTALWALLLIWSRMQQQIRRRDV